MLYAQRLNALNVTTGSAAATALNIATAYSNIGVTFSPTAQNQRAALALAHDAGGNPLIYVAWGGHCDDNPTNYSGKAAVFTLTTQQPPCTSTNNPCLAMVATFDDQPLGPNGSPVEDQGGIWMGGGGPAIDDTTTDKNSVDAYLSTGNGAVSNPYVSGITGSALGQSVLRLNVATTNNNGYTYGMSPTGAYTTGDYNILNCGSGSNDAAWPCNTSTPVCQNLLQLPPPYASPNNTYCAKTTWMWIPAV
jgi:hypothetical protein